MPFDWKSLFRVSKKKRSKFAEQLLALEQELEKETPEEKQKRHIEIREKQIARCREMPLLDAAYFIWNSNGGRKKGDFDLRDVFIDITHEQIESAMDQAWDLYHSAGNYTKLIDEVSSVDLMSKIELDNPGFSKWCYRSVYDKASFYTVK